MDSVDGFFTKDLKGTGDHRLLPEGHFPLCVYWNFFVKTPTIRHMRYANKLLDRPVLFVREVYCQNSMRQKLSSDNTVAEQDFAFQTIHGKCRISWALQWHSFERDF